MIRIGVNALYLIPGGVGGTEIYLRSLLAALAGIDSRNRYLVFTNRETGDSLAPAGFTIVETGVRASFRPGRILWEQAVLPLEATERRIDVLFNPGFTAPMLAACPQVTVFHDLQHKRHPQHFRWFDLPFWRILLYGAAHRSDFVLADSDATRHDVLRFYRLPKQRVRTVPLGVDPCFFELERRPEPMLLTVSTLHPHKNLDALLRAFAGFRKRHPEFRLVIAGLRGFAAEQLESIRREAGLGSGVEFTGWVPREELYSLYARAWAFVYPSTFEGFGLPVLEALAAGVPCACSSIEPLHGIAGGAALEFAPGDLNAIEAAMERIVTDEQLRAALAAAGPARAAAFSWRATADKTLAVLEEAAGSYTYTRSTRGLMLQSTL
jgi:glycosyltransferase involved in cell wall biosynthesis